MAVAVLGQQIAKILVQRQHQVISVSRHGKPATLSASWSHQVQWVCSDVTHDTNWQEQVQRADWVIDTVGILFENPRKENLSTANSDASEKSALFSTTKSQLSFYLFQPILFPFEKIYGCQIGSGGTNPPRSRRSSNFYPSLLVGQERTGTILFSKCIYF